MIKTEQLRLGQDVPIKKISEQIVNNLIAGRKATQNITSTIVGAGWMSIPNYNWKYRTWFVSYQETPPLKRLQYYCGNKDMIIRSNKLKDGRYVYVVWEPA